ncbi:MAG: MEDS domain-containing protein [Asgard group archaeon]
MVNGMIDLAFYFATLAVLITLITFIVRQKGSYFKSVQILLLIAFSGVASVVLTNAIKNYLINESWIMLPYVLWGTSAVLVAALAVEHTAFMLHKRQQMMQRKGFFSSKINIISLFFKVSTLAVLITAWIFNPWQVRYSIPDLWGNLVYGFVYDQWFTAVLGGLLIAVILYPCTVFILLSRKCNDKHVSDALWWLGICWAATGVTLMFFHGLVRNLNIELMEISSLSYVLYYGIVAYYFKQTTTLEGLFNTTYPSLRLREGEHLVVFYTNKVDKWKLFSTYIRQGLRQGDRVVYAYSNIDSEIVRSRLKEHGMEVEKHEKKGSLVLMSVSHVYIRNGVIDKSQLINFWNDLKIDAKKGGFKHERDLFDLGDLSFLGDQKEKYFEYLREANTRLMDPFMIELRAVNIENLSPQLIQEFKFLSTKSMDLLEYSDKFSKRIGVNHKHVVGRNLLLEFDPAANYEEAIRDFVLEASANAETVIIFTGKGSVIHTILSIPENVKFLLLTQLASTPKTDKHTGEILIPANNTSLLLDALNKTVKSHPDGNFNFVFDNLTSLILQVGFEKTYNFVRYALEMLSSINATAIFLFNSNAHDQKIVSSLRSLFSNQVIFEKGGVEIIKLPETLMKAR